jgi:hypothetical protein
MVGVHNIWKGRNDWRQHGGEIMTGDGRVQLTVEGADELLCTDHTAKPRRPVKLFTESCDNLDKENSMEGLHTDHDLD